MAEETRTYVTDEIRALIGRESGFIGACDPVERSEVRRFTQAIMDPDPVYWDDRYAATTKFRGVVAPPLFPAFISRRPPGSADPLDRFQEDREWDGITGQPSYEDGERLPPIDLPLPRLLNGGVEAEFHQLAKPGDRIFAKRRYVDVTERESRGGHLVFIITETTYTNQDDEVLLTVRNTIIRR